jgi:hypothetical protein
VFGHETVNELVAYRLGQSLGFNAAACELHNAVVYIDGKEVQTRVCIAKSFKPVNASRESFDKYYENRRSDNSESPLDFCKRQGWSDCIYKMFIFDYLIINRDRHGANLEVFKNGNEFLSPLFDNGMSFVFLYTDNDSDLDSFNDLADLPVNNFIGTRSLQKNLEFIDNKVKFNRLPPNLHEILFAGLDGVMPELWFKKIITIIEKRWANVKDFRVT